jgi:iron complex outermembrane receptor protein
MNRIALAVKSALGIAILVPPSLVFAATAPDSGALEEIVVTGYRVSVEKSLEAKREATEVVDVVTADDIGKMPDKNVADSLARVAGVTTSSAGATEGGFDENDRISMRGTNPSLTQTLINGHGVASGDWFALDQTTTVGRSVSYTLLPSEIVSKIVVQKSSSAELVEGGVAGSVNIVTRKPLEDFSKPFTLEASAGAVYADLPSKTDPQFSALGAWKNEANNFGVMLQLFYEKRDLRRDGIEVLGYDTIAKGSPIATSNPDLSGVQYPHEQGAAFFTQTRERQGGLIDLEFKPIDNDTLDLSAFSSKLNATNYNRNYLIWGTHFINNGFGQAPLPGYTVAGNTLTSATFAPVAGTDYGVYDQISRPDESATSNFVNLDNTWNATDTLTIFGQAGYSWGDGKTPNQNVSETSPGIGTGAGYQLNGVGNGPSFNLGTQNNTTPNPGGVPVAFGWIFGDQNIDVKDTETWAKLDGAFKIDNNAWQDLKFGVRYEKHGRTSDTAIGQGPTAAGQSTSAYPTGGFSNYPSNFNTFGASIPTGVWYWSPDQLAAYNSPTNVNRDPVSRLDWNSLYQVYENDAAAFVQADFKGSNWAGNLGLRYVHTDERVVTYAADVSNTPGAITTSAFGPFIPVNTKNSYNDVLPTANFKIDVTPDLVARFAAGETMTRADYSALGGATSLAPPGAAAIAPEPQPHGSGSTGNPNLAPIRSTNLDAGLEWYFAKQSLLSATLFYMDLRNYVGYGTVTKNYLTYSTVFPNGTVVPYDLTQPINTKGRVEGAEFQYQQAFTENFGVIANYTYADGKQTSDLPASGDDRLVGTSKNTYNIIAYAENQHFSARVAWNYRSSFYSGLDRSTAFTQYSIGDLSASLGWTINQNFAITLDGQSLNNPTLKYYALNQDQPRAFYKNGSQYYLNFRFKM